MIAVKIRKIVKKKLKEPAPVYDVIGATPQNNFLIKAGSHSIISHNCSPNDVIGLDILCLTGDTKIWYEDGTWKTLESLENKKLQLYNYNDKEKYIALSDICEVKKTKETQDLIEIITADGSSIKCTPEHRFLLKTGQYKLAIDLTIEDELEDGEDI